MKEEEMEKIGELIRQVLLDEENLLKVKQKVEELAKDFQEVKYCFQ